MKSLEEKIKREGKVFPGQILKVGSFLNQQLDVEFLMEMGEEIAKLFADDKPTKVLTIEASGIAVAVCAASYLHVPVVFAKKHKSANVASDVYSAKVHSYTHGNDYEAVVSKEYLQGGERILIIDDFLATGEAMNGLIEIVEKAGANVVGIADAIEKRFQGGGNALRSKGYHVESLALVESMSDYDITFGEI